MPIESNPLRICLLSYRSHPHCGGQGVYVSQLSKALVHLGHQVDVVSGPPYPELDDGIRLIRLPSLDLYNPDDLFRTPSLKELADPVNFIEWAGVCSMGFPEPLTFGIRARRFLKRQGHRYDIIHDNQSLSYGIWAIAKKLPTVATIHHPITVDRRLAISSAPTFTGKLKQMRWYSFIRMQKKVAPTLARIITVSRAACRDISREFKIPAARFTIAPNGIDTTVFRPQKDIRRQAGRIIVTNSADTPLKGLGYLLKAVARLGRSRRLHLVVVGQPKANGTVANMIRHLGIGKNVEFTGRLDQDELVRQYATAAVAVVPSVYEGFGLPAGEAMACGTPVVSTTGGALPEVVGQAGVLVPPADSAALAKALAKVLDNPGLAACLGKAGYQRIRKEFTWERAAEKTVDAYRKAICDYLRAPQNQPGTRGQGT